jgi:hypothetical protein
MPHSLSLTLTNPLSAIISFKALEASKRAEHTKAICVCMRTARVGVDNGNDNRSQNDFRVIFD